MGMLSKIQRRQIYILLDFLGAFSLFFYLRVHPVFFQSSQWTRISLNFLKTSLLKSSWVIHERGYILLYVFCFVLFLELKQSFDDEL